MNVLSRCKSRMYVDDLRSSRRELSLLMEEHAALLDQTRLLLRELQEHSSRVSELLEVLQSGDRSLWGLKM